MAQRTPVTMEAIGEHLRANFTTAAAAEATRVGQLELAERIQGTAGWIPAAFLDELKTHGGDLDAVLDDFTQRCETTRNTEWALTRRDKARAFVRGAASVFDLFGPRRSTPGSRS